MMYVPRSLLLLTLACPTLAFAADPGATVVVEGKRETPDVPKGGPIPKPAKPSFDLRLPAYSLASRDLRFPSGLRVILQSDHSQPVVSLTMYVDRGSTSDPVGKEGIAHFVEHLWFRSKHINPNTKERLPKVWDILSELGCNLNASTADDWTNYMSVCPSSSLPQLLKLESLRLSEAVEGVEPEVVSIEREVIRNELRMRYENSWFTAMPYLFEHLYPAGHPYARLGIGSHESLLNINLGDIQQFVKTNYRPENSTLVIVGDFDLNEAQSMLYENFNTQLLDKSLTEADIAYAPKPNVEKPDKNNPGDWLTFILDHNDHTKPLKTDVELQPRIAGPAPEPPMPHDQILTRHKAPIEKPMVVVAWTVPGAYRGNDATLNVMANIAGSYMNDYFANSEPTVNTDSSGCFSWTSKVDSKIICVIEMKTGDGVNPDRIAEKAVDQVSLMWNPDYNYDPNLNVRWIDNMLARSRMAGMADVLGSLDLFATVGGGRATDIAQHAHFTGSAFYHSDQMKEIMSISGQTIADTAEKYLRRNRYVKIYLEPLGKDEEIAAQSAEYRGASQGDVVRSSIDPAKITPQVIRDFTIPPDISKIVEKTLPNGLRIVVMPHGEAPLVEAGLLIGGGSSSAPLGMDEWVKALSTTVWNDRTRKTDPLRIAGEWSQNGYKNHSWHSVKSSSGNVDGALWLLREAMEQFKPNTEFKSDYVKDYRGGVRRSWKERFRFVEEDKNNAVFPNDPAVFSIDWDDIDRLAALPNAELNQYIANKYQPTNTTLVIVGSVDPEKTLALADYYFQGWQPRKGAVVGKVAPLPGPSTPTLAPTIKVYDDPKKTQTQVTFTCPLPKAGPTDDARLQILSSYLDDHAWLALRENGGVTYGAGAYAIPYEGGSAELIMQSLVQNNGVGLAVKTFDEMAKSAASGQFDPKEIQGHKLNLAKKYVLNQQSVPQMRGRLVSQLVNGRDWTTMAGYADRLAAVDPAALKAAVGDCDKHYIIQLEGPSEKITPELDKVGVKYEVVDWKARGREELKKHDPKAYEKVIKAEEKEKAKKAKEEAANPAPATPAPAPAPEPAPTNPAPGTGK
jgi:zinc protease